MNVNEKLDHRPQRRFCLLFWIKFKISIRGRLWVCVEKGHGKRHGPWRIALTRSFLLFFVFVFKSLVMNKPKRKNIFQSAKHVDIIAILIWVLVAFFLENIFPFPFIDDEICVSFQPSCNNSDINWNKDQEWDKKLPKTCFVRWWAVLDISAINWCHHLHCSNKSSINLKARKTSFQVSSFNHLKALAGHKVQQHPRTRHASRGYF